MGGFYQRRSCHDALMSTRIMADLEGFVSFHKGEHFHMSVLYQKVALALSSCNSVA